MNAQTLTYEEKRKKEQAELSRRREKLHGLAAALCQSPAFAGWSVGRNPDPDFDNLKAEIVGPGGARRFILAADRYDKQARVRVYGRYPQPITGSYWPGKDAPDVGLTLDRPVDALIRDISRRFLPEYEAAFIRASEAVNTTNVRMGKLVEAGRKYAALLEVPFNADRVREGVEVCDYRPEWIVIKSSDAEKFSIRADNLTENQLDALLVVLNPHKAKDCGVSDE